MCGTQNGEGGRGEGGVRKAVKVPSLAAYTLASSTTDVTRSITMLAPQNIRKLRVFPVIVAPNSLPTAYEYASWIAVRDLNTASTAIPGKRATVSSMGKRAIRKRKHRASQARQQGRTGREKPLETR